MDGEDEHGPVRLPIETWPEWIRYEQTRNRESFPALARRAKAESRSRELLGSMIVTLGPSENWRVAQHIALVALDARALTEGQYYAHRGRQLSNGDPLARIVWARVLVEREMPLGALPELALVRALARRTHDRQSKRMLQREIAELHACTYAYIGDATAATRWYEFLRRTRGGPSPGTSVGVFRCGGRRGNFRLAVAAAESLALYVLEDQVLSGQVQNVLRRALVSLLGKASAP